MKVIVMSCLELKNLLQTAINEVLHENGIEIYGKGKPNQDNNQQNDLIVRKEALELLNISSSTLWLYEKEGKIQGYGVKGKRYYKRSEILKSIIEKK